MFLSTSIVYMPACQPQRLKYDAVAHEPLKINVSGDMKGKDALLVFQLCVQGKHGERFTLKASAVPNICAPLEDYRLYVDGRGIEKAIQSE